MSHSGRGFSSEQPAITWLWAVRAEQANAKPPASMGLEISPQPPSYGNCLGFQLQTPSQLTLLFIRWKMGGKWGENPLFLLFRPHVGAQLWPPAEGWKGAGAPTGCPLSPPFAQHRGLLPSSAAWGCSTWRCSVAPSPEGSTRRHQPAAVRGRSGRLRTVVAMRSSWGKLLPGGMKQQRV